MLFDATSGRVQTDFHSWVSLQGPKDAMRHPGPGFSRPRSLYSFSRQCLGGILRVLQLKKRRKEGVWNRLVRPSGGGGHQCEERKKTKNNPVPEQGIFGEKWQLQQRIITPSYLQANEQTVYQVYLFKMQQPILQKNLQKKGRRQTLLRVF